MSLGSTIGRAFATSESQVVIIEYPPGMGKTWNLVKQALGSASAGRTVILALPNHQSLLTAFGYALVQFMEMEQTKPERKLPYIIYYSGVSRYCPFLRGGGKGEELFAKALDYLAGEGLVSSGEAERVKKLGPRLTSRIYGFNHICRNYCPVYKRRLEHSKAKIFAPKSAIEALSSPKLFMEEEKVAPRKVSEAVDYLRTRQFIVTLDPEIGENGEGLGFCVRSVLQRSIYGRRQVYMRGVLILTPVQALGFIARLVMKRISVLKDHGFNLPKPVIAVDEYDSYIYKFEDIPPVTLKQVERELKLAREVVEVEREKARRGEPFDRDLLTAAVVAGRILRRIKELCEAHKKGRNGSMPDVDASPANFVMECYREPIIHPDGSVTPPLAPRIIDLDREKMLPRIVVEYAKKINERGVRKEGIAYLNVDTLEERGVRYYLSLWENFIVENFKDTYKYAYPSFEHSYARVYEVETIDLPVPASVAKAFYTYIASSYKMITVFYRLASVTVKTGRERRMIKTVKLSTYDNKLYQLLLMGYSVVLTTATGLPWHTLFFRTRSSGEGARGRVVYKAASSLSAILSDWKLTSVRGAGKFTSVIVEGIATPQKIKIRIEAVKSEGITAYSDLARIIPLSSLPAMPSKQELARREGLVNLEKSLENYIETSLYLLGKAETATIPGGLNPSILVLTQRKDLALTYTVELLKAITGKHGYSVEVKTCSGYKCAEGCFTRSVLSELKRRPSHCHVRVYTGRGVVEVFVTWLRSLMSRGIDLPENVYPVATLMVGSPYRPPHSFDIPVERGRVEEVSTYASRLIYDVFIGGEELERMTSLGHQPIDISESINEFVQAVGRATRTVWKYRVKGYPAPKTLIVIPAFIVDKLYKYSPYWFKTIMEESIPDLTEY